jgi:polar amino acid transport system substrate-binding protein
VVNACIFEYFCQVIEKFKPDYYVFIIILLASGQSKAIELQFVTEHYPPFQIIADNGDVSGFSVDVITTALDTTSISYKIKAYPWYRAYSKVIESENTCIFLLFRTPEREGQFQWVTTILSTQDDLIGLTINSHRDIDSLQQVKQYRVAVIKQDRTHQLFLSEGFVEGKNLFVVNDTFSLMKLLERGEVDFIVSAKGRVDYLTSMNTLPAGHFKSYFKVDDKPIDLYLACNNDTPESVVSTLNRVLNEVKNGEDYQKILDEWSL